MLSSWFLYSEKDNYVVEKWKERVVDYWNKRNSMHHYFWFHQLFDDLYRKDEKFRGIWNATGKIDTEIPHFIKNSGMLKPVSEKVKEHIQKVSSPMYKLTYKFNAKCYNDNCNLGFLINERY